MSSSFCSCVSHAELSTQTVVNYKKGGQRFMNQVQTMPLFDDEGDLAAFASLLHEIPEVKIRRKTISEFFFWRRGSFCITSPHEIPEEDQSFFWRRRSLCVACPHEIPEAKKRLH